MSFLTSLSSSFNDSISGIKQAIYDSNKWRKDEEEYIKGCKPLHNFISRQKKEPNLPPSSIEGDVWFTTPSYKFGDVLIEHTGFPPFYGTVIGMEWDEYDWEYTLLGDMGTGIPFKEHELTKFNPVSVQSLEVYFHGGEWVFDAPEYNLEKEPFVSGIDTMINRLTILIPDAKKGFKLLFSHSPFPDYRCHLDWQSEESGGNWYHCPQFNMRGWLCPALFSYFDEAPTRLYAKAEPINQ